MNPSPARRPSGPERPAPGLGMLIFLHLIVLLHGFGLVTPRDSDAAFGFGEPILVNNSAFDDGSTPFTPTDRDPSVRIVNGVHIAMWLSFHNADVEKGGDGDLMIARSTDGGLTWTDPNVVFPYALTDSGHDFFEDGCLVEHEGVLFLVWDSREPTLAGGKGGDADVMFARSDDAGETWTSPVLVNSAGLADSWLDGVPRILSPDGMRLVCTWVSTNPLDGSDDYDVYAATSTDGGVTWSEELPLTEAAYSDHVLGLEFQFMAESRTGTWIVAWTSPDDFGGTLDSDWDILFTRSLDFGETWEPARPLDNFAATDSAADGYMQTVTGWEGPVLATNDRGTWICVWTTRKNLSGRTGGTGIDVLYARSLDDGLTWEDPRLLNSNASTDPSGPAGNDRNPSVVYDPAGAWMTTWSTTAFSGPGYGALSLAISRSLDDGLTWSPTAPLNRDAESNRDGYDIIAFFVRGEDGAWFGTWETDRPSYGGDTFYDTEVLGARSANILGPDPIGPDARLIRDLILGRFRPDANGDGVVDVSDMLTSPGARTRGSRTYNTMQTTNMERERLHDEDVRNRPEHQDVDRERHDVRDRDPRGR